MKNHRNPELGRQLKQIWSSLRVIDYFILVGSLVVFAITTTVAFGFSGNAKAVTIKAGDQVYVYPLDKDLTFAVKGPIGLTQIEIKDKAVRVIDSPCRDKICVHAGWLLSGGQWAACLPNRVFVSIDAGPSGKSDQIDARAY